MDCMRDASSRIRRDDSPFVNSLCVYSAALRDISSLRAAGNFIKDRAKIIEGYVQGYQ